MKVLQVLVEQHVVDCKGKYREGANGEPRFRKCVSGEYELKMCEGNLFFLLGFAYSKKLASYYLLVDNLVVP